MGKETKAVDDRIGRHVQIAALEEERAAPINLSGEAMSYASLWIGFWPRFSEGRGSVKYFV